MKHKRHSSPKHKKHYTFSWPKWQRYDYSADGSMVLMVKRQKK